MSIEFINPDPQRFWQPNSEPQRKFISLPNTFDEALYGGAAGGGKTESLLWLPIVKGWFQHPKFHGIMFRSTFPQLKESLIPRSIEIYKGIFGSSYNGSDHCHTFPSGAQIRFSYLETMKDAQQHNTAEYNYMAFEEATEFLKDVYIFMQTRLRSSYDFGPSLSRSASNPGNIGHIWNRERFVDPWRDGFRPIHEKLDDGSFNRRIYIPASVFDNKDLIRRNPNYISKLLLLPEAEKRAKLYGDWYAMVGQVFTEFRETRYADEPANALHVIDPFSVPFYWPKIIAIDWGYRAKTAVIWAAISPDGRVYIYRCYSCVKTSIEQWSMDIKKLSEFDENIVAYVIDPSSARNLGQKTIKQQVIDATGWKLEDADNDRIGGISLIHDYLRWKQRPASFTPKENMDAELAARILRNMGEIKYNEYMDQFEPQKPETNIPRLQIMKMAQNKDLIDTMSQCVHDDKKVEDVKEFFGDDFFDCLRYNLKAVSRFFALSKKAGDKYAELGNIVADYQNTGDYSHYLRRMETFDKKHRSTNVVTRVFHKTRTLKGLLANRSNWSKLVRRVH